MTGRKALFTPRRSLHTSRFFWLRSCWRFAKLTAAAACWSRSACTPSSANLRTDGGATPRAHPLHPSENNIALATHTSIAAAVVRWRHPGADPAARRRAREERLRGAGAPAAGVDLIAIDAAVVEADVDDGVAEVLGGAVVSVVGDAVARDS